MLFQVVLFGSIIVGILLIIFSLFIFTADAKNSPNNYFEASNTIKALESSIDEMDKAMDELNSTSKSIFSELDEKYQELLFLYALIDEKKNELTEIYKNNGVKKQSREAEVQAPAKTYDNPHLDEIKALKAEGLSVSQIAKKLSIGQGEVKLILELGKAR